MRLELNFSSVLEIMSCVSAFMFGFFLLFSKTDNIKANRFLAMSVISLSLEISLPIIEQTNLVITSWFSFSLFTLPLFMFYVLNIVNIGYSKKLYILFLPGVLFNILAIFFTSVAYYGAINYIFNILVIVWLLSFLRRHHLLVLNFYSSINNRTLKWIYVVVYINIAFLLIWIGEDILDLYMHESLSETFSFLSALLTFILVVWIGYFGFNQHTVFKDRLSILTDTSDESSKDDDIISCLSVESDVENIEGLKQEREHFNSIELQLKNEKLYLNAQLDLRSLSDCVDVNSRELSYLINRYSGMNFFQYINSFRVEEFKNNLCSDKAQQLSIIGLAEEAGFNSKSTFYKVFKEKEGMTPKEYGLLQKES